MEKDTESAVARKIWSMKINAYSDEDLHDGFPVPKEGSTIHQVHPFFFEKPDSELNDDDSGLIEQLPVTAEVEPHEVASPRANSAVTSKNPTTGSYKKTSDSSFHPFAVTGLNHVAFCCENLERTLEFYCGLLGLKTNPNRPDLPYRGAWLYAGSETEVHLMEVPNPDPIHGRPVHGGYDRHACISCNNMETLKKSLHNEGVPYQLSMVPSVFCRDPDGNGLEFLQHV